MITNPIDNSIVHIGHRQDNVYMIDLNNIFDANHCLVATNTKMNVISWLWNRRLGHTSMNQISKLIRRDLVKGINSAKVSPKPG